MSQVRKSNRPIAWLINVIAAASIIAAALLLSANLPRGVAADEARLYLPGLPD